MALFVESVFALDQTLKGFARELAKALIAASQ